MDLRELDKPFDPKDIEWRIGRCGQRNGEVWAIALAYITARAIHDRLDEVCGKEKWQSRYVEHLGETVCEIGIKINNEWVWKAGGADKTDFEAYKGGLSSAEKRAGVPWGIGRYLYSLDQSFVTCTTEKQKGYGWHYQAQAKKKDGSIKCPAFYWKTPYLPKWALPEGFEFKKKENNGDRPKGNEKILAIFKKFKENHGDHINKDTPIWVNYKNDLKKRFGGSKMSLIIEQNYDIIMKELETKKGGNTNDDPWLEPIRDSFNEQQF